MKKILIQLIISLIFLFWYNSLYAADYTVINNTNDWVHNSMADTLIKIWSDYLNGTVSPADSRNKLVDYIAVVSWWWATASATVDANWALHIWCTNNGSLIVFQPNATTWWWSTPAWTPELIAPTATPEPVVTSSSSTSAGCSSYISSWSTIWSTCAIQWTWDANWTIQCNQTSSFSPVSSSCGSQTCTTTTTDWVAGSPVCWACTWCPWDAASPAPTTETKTISLNLNPASTATDYNNAVANNADNNTFSINLSAVINQNQSIVWWWTNWSIWNFYDASNNPSDRIWLTWTALSFSPTNINLLQAGTYEINIKSVTPFIWNSKIWLKAWNTDLFINNVSLSFNKPFVWNIDTWNDSKNNWTGKSTIWTTSKYKLSLVEKSSIPWNSLVNYSLDNFVNKMSPNGSGLEIQSNSVSWSTLNSKNWAIFYARINTSTDATSLNTNPWLKLASPIISYDLGWQKVKYYLSEQDSWNDTSPIKNIWSEFLWVKIIWSLQWWWKQELTWQKSNISDLSKIDIRTSIRKNAYSYIKSMTHWQIVNGVKYIDWDITLNASSNLWYETLVVKDGNVIISGDLTQSKLWIIVLKDWYDVNSWFNGKWNIYVKPNVQNINAIIYADWWLMSTDSDGNLYTSDSTDRTSVLKNQLTIYWSLFTRNTIGWAILAWWKYILPGGSKIDDFNKAMIYDLNFIRRSNAWCIQDSTLNCIYKDPFIIKYDTKIQKSPPKLF